MRKWALTTVVKHEPDPYTENIWPLTAPLFADYAARHDMDFVPTWVTHEECAWMYGTKAGNLGTSAVYTSIPARRALLADYAGVVYLDQDAVILNPDRDITAGIDAARPVGMTAGLTGALMVLQSCRYTKVLLADCWRQRELWKHLQWAEEGYFKQKFGWDPVWEHGDPASFVGETGDTRWLRVIPQALFHPLDRPTDASLCFASNPGGIHPLARRIEIIHQLIEERYALHGS